MKFRFWGVRGSIPSPGPRTVRYGGNTTCIEVQSSDGTLIVLDAGTGLYALAQDLMARRAAGGGDIHANIFITHSHWDHIHGLPFFTPLFVKGSRVCLHGAHDPVTGQGIEHVMGVQLQNSYFPVSEERMDATIAYRTLQIGEPCQLGETRIDNVLMNHPVTNLGYRIACRGKSLFFTGDHEPFANPYPRDDPRHAPAALEIARRQAGIDAAMAGVDALIVDCSYTIQEYPARQGWGHGTFDGALEMALRTGAKALYCTHHEPTRSDDELEAMFADALARFQGRRNGLRVILAREGLEVAL
jgi:phosphoribosyl 1,2-cyclic phosphodiesterase